MSEQVDAMFATLRDMAHPPAPALIVEDSDQAALRAAVRARTIEQRVVTRARIVLRSAEGAPIERIAAELGVAIMTVKLWRRRYAAAGLTGLADAPRPGHPSTYARADRDRLVALTLGPPPDGTTHWSVRRMAQRTGMSPSTVHRIWAELGYRPHRTETFKFRHAPRPGGRLPGLPAARRVGCGRRRPRQLRRHRRAGHPVPSPGPADRALDRAAARHRDGRRRG